MPTPDNGGKRTGLAAGALLLLMPLCCGLPLLIAGSALAGVGSVLGSPWVIGAAVALLIAVIVWRIRRHAGAARSSDAECCSPEPLDRDRVRSTTESPTHHKER